MSFTVKKSEPLVTQKLIDWEKHLRKKWLLLLEVTQGNFFINAVSVSTDSGGTTRRKCLQKVVQAELSHCPEMGY